MDIFVFIIILVVITGLGKVATAIGVPLAGSVGDLLREMAAERRARRQALESGGVAGGEVVEELERRLGRIEDRLDFLEALKSPERPGSLSPGQDQ